MQTALQTRAAEALELRKRRTRAAPSSTVQLEEATAAGFRRIRLYPKQAAIVDDPARFTLCEATTKAGKTASHLEWLLEDAIKAGAGNWWWVATVYDTADIAFRRARDRLQGYLESKGARVKVSDAYPFKANLSRMYLTVNGATIWFKSADKPDSLYGEDVRGAVGDEVTRWKPEAWTALYSTLTATRGRAKLIGNVKGRRNWAYLLARKAEAGELDWGYHKLTAWDAVSGGVLEQDTIEQAQRDLPENVFRELYLAEAGDDGGNPFGIGAIHACRIPARSSGPVVAYGVDLAKSNDWCWLIGLDAQGHEVVSERWQGDWGSTKKRIVARVGTVPTLVDSTGVGDPIVEDMQLMVSVAHNTTNIEGFKFSSTSKQQLMEGLASSIQDGKVRFHDPTLIAELEAFEYEYTRTGARYSAPVGIHDDGVCALALAERMRQTLPPPPPPPRPRPNFILPDLEDATRTNPFRP